MEPLLDAAKMGYFLVYKGNKDIFGRGIKAEQIKRGFTPEQAEYSHVEVSGGGPRSVRVNPGTIRPIDIRKEYAGRYVKIVRYVGYPEVGAQRHKVAYCSATLCNLKYDFWGVLRFKIPWLMSFSGKWFCSEAALWSLQQEFPGALGIKPVDCMPAHFLLPEYFDLVWEGVITKDGL
jgi:hypothetical protein